MDARLQPSQTQAKTPKEDTQATMPSPNEVIFLFQPPKEARDGPPAHPSQWRLLQVLGEAALSALLVRRTPFGVQVE